MKNYKDMADAVFARRDEYVASVKRKKKIAVNAGLSLCAICLAVLGAFGIWQSGVLTPDPNVIGTKPQGYTEVTNNSTLHSLSSNATSEGEHSDATEIISGNTKPQSTTSNILPTENNKTQSTDPAEKPDSPAVKPTKPAVKPTVPQIRPTLPTLPVGPQPPTFKPQGSPTPGVPPTSGDTPKPPVIVTDPVETEPWHPDTEAPPIVTPPVTDGMERPGSDSNTALPDEPEATYTEPCWTQPPCMEPTTCSPTTAVLTDPTDPLAGQPETAAPMDPAPPTEAVTTPPGQNIVKGKVFDQYGNPVKGAVVSLYSGGTLIDSFTTQSSGYYYLTGFRPFGKNYLVITSAPKEYSVTGAKFGFDGGYCYMDLICNKK
ncbi:MAG: carboxypeptidase regulatory-like domain-containing protein [Clostridia bacterium]|nr:carboxypeptidase regulatory-like domain-containing protein [Clostridia bacterium]